MQCKCMFNCSLQSHLMHERNRKCRMETKEIREFGYPCPKALPKSDPFILFPTAKVYYLPTQSTVSRLPAASSVSKASIQLQRVLAVARQRSNDKLNLVFPFSNLQTAFLTICFSASFRARAQKISLTFDF